MRWRVWIAGLGLALAATARAETIGPAAVIDGNTMKIADETIRLHGIDAPEPDQVCALDGQPWACGRAAADLLRALTTGKQVTCRGSTRDSEGRRIARCHVGWMDLGAEMVDRGMAVADPEAPGDYAPNEREARARGVGIFAGEFVAPARWRRGARHPIESAEGP